MKINALALFFVAASVEATRMSTDCNEGAETTRQIEFLDRHDLYCPSGTAMGQYRMATCGHDKFKFDFECNSMDWSASPRGDKTDCDEIWNRPNEFLDRHDVRCNSNEVLQGWKMEVKDGAGCGGDDGRIFYDCLQVPSDFSMSCSSTSTNCDKLVGEQLKYFDRQNVNCPSHQPYLQRFQLQNCNGGKQRFDYTCCSVSSPAPTPYPTPSPTKRPTPSPTPSPTDAPTKPLIASSSGDPHFKTWTGEKYDFHGGCDLVLLDNPHFADGLGLTIHIRTKIKTWWSHIETAAIKIGDDILEITGGIGEIPYWINGEKTEDMQTGDAVLGDFAVHFNRISDHASMIHVALGGKSALSIETYNKFVRVNVKVGSTDEDAFLGTYGMMGSYPEGKMIGRDMMTVFDDPNEFGQEWHVLSTEPKLFHTDSDVQHPMKCAMPDTVDRSQARRRLGETLITEEEAILACARVNEEERDACVFDVLATNDKGMAGAY